MLQSLIELNEQREKLLPHSHLLPNVDEDKQNNPDNIDEVPEQRSRVHAEVSCVVVARDERTYQNNRLQQNAGENVQTVETC